MEIGNNNLHCFVCQELFWKFGFAMSIIIVKKY
jgi:hypothetical protein